MQKLKLSKELQRATRRRIAKRKQSEILEYAKCIGIILIFEFIAVFGAGASMLLLLKIVDIVR